ncbi:MAG: hypothetical protein AB8A39_07490 [Prochlorococcus sp.]
MARTGEVDIAVLLKGCANDVSMIDLLSKLLPLALLALGFSLPLI